MAAVAAAASFAPWSYGADQAVGTQMQGVNHTAQSAAAHGTVIEGRKLIGMKVENANHENLGRIEDAVVDLDQGRIAYFVLSSGGTLGIGDKYIAVPAQALKFQGANQPGLLNISTDQLKSMQGFDKNNWPEFGDPAFGAQIHKQYGVDPYWTQGNQPQVNRAKFWTNRLSKLDDHAVQNPAGEKLGQIEELMVDTREGRIAYALLQFGGVMGFKEKNVFVPWSALKLDADKKVYILDTDTKTLQSMAFPEKSWPDYNNEAWGRQVHQQFQRQPYWETYGYAGGEGRGDYGYSRLFQSGNRVTIDGKVSDVQRYTLHDGNEGLRLKVTAADGRTIFVDLGSKSQLGNMNFKSGDPVKVTGQEVTILHGSEVQYNNQTLQIKHD